MRETDAKRAAERRSPNPRLKMRPRLSTSALKKARSSLPTSVPFFSFLDFCEIILKVLGWPTLRSLSSLLKRLNQFSSISSSFVIRGRCLAILALLKLAESTSASTRATPCSFDGELSERVNRISPNKGISPCVP